MKKVAAMAIIAGMVLSMAACGSSSDSSTAAATDDAAATASAAEEETSAPAEASASGDFTTVEEGELHMATNAAFPPYEMTSDDGGFEGIDVEIAEAIADKLGLELVVDDMDFSSVIAAVQSGKEDMVMAGLTITDERKQNIDFSDVYAEGVQVVIVPEDSDITSVDDLANDKMIGVQDGTTGYIYASDTVENGGYGEDHVTAYTNGATAVQALLSGKVDAVIIDNNPAKEYVAANEGLKILDSEYVSEEYAIGLSKDNPELREAVNNALNELIEDGTVDEIVNKYIKAE